MMSIPPVLSRAVRATASGPVRVTSPGTAAATLARSASGSTPAAALSVTCCGPVAPGQVWTSAARAISDRGPKPDTSIGVTIPLTRSAIPARGASIGLPDRADPRARCRSAAVRESTRTSPAAAGAWPWTRWYQRRAAGGSVTTWLNDGPSAKATRSRATRCG